MRTASKIRSLSNEVLRRLLNTSEDVLDSVRCAILDTFAQKLYKSGYGLYQIKSESSQLRDKKKLTEKREWFRNTKSSASDPVQNLGPVEMGEKAVEQNLQSQEKKHWTAGCRQGLRLVGSLAPARTRSRTSRLGLSYLWRTPEEGTWQKS